MVITRRLFGLLGRYAEQQLRLNPCRLSSYLGKGKLCLLYKILVYIIVAIVFFIPQIDSFIGYQPDYMIIIKFVRKASNCLWIQDKIQSH